VTQHECHLGQGRTAAEHLGSSSVPQSVRIRPNHSSAAAGGADKVGEPGGSQPAPWRVGAEEHYAARADRSPVPQIVGHGFTDIGRQRETFKAVTLAANLNLTGSPVKVVELQRRHLTGPKT
jgi:hypothetical protein